MTTPNNNVNKFFHWSYEDSANANAIYILNLKLKRKKVKTLGDNTE